jgi:two-component system, OmpR family, manganese sensing sensor histidine kinase
MASAIGLQTSVRELDSGPLALERRLLLSYLATFAAIFLLVALVVRFAFIAFFDQQTAARLEDLARAGIRSVLFVGDTVEIDRTEISNAALLTRDQGLQWFDRKGRLLGAEGLTPTAETHQQFNSVMMTILNPRTHRLVGSVRASGWNKQQRADMRYLDIGLSIGTLLAIIVGSAAGLALAHRAVKPVAQSFQRLRDFTADASHELRGPLTAIAGTADAALRDSQRDPARDRSRFEAIADGAGQISRLTSDLLLLAGADRSLERELFVVDLAATIQELADRYRLVFSEAGIAFDVASQQTAIVYGNPSQIERILSNLLDNALRYTPSGGRVDVELKRSGSEITVLIRDSGIGIAPEHLERIFDRFWRADPARSGGGSGLGLAIARALARRHGGDVAVKSGLGLGSEFAAWFPIRPARID